MATAAANTHIVAQASHMEDGAVDGAVDRVMDEAVDGSMKNVEQEKSFKVYPRRWAVLTAVVLLNISNASLWINISPVAYTVASYFHRQLWEVNQFSLVFLFVSIPFSFISTFSVNKIGLRPSIHIGAGLNVVGGVLRAVATSGIIPNLDAQFALSLTGQTLAGMAQSFLLFIPTKVSQLWFPKDARAIATTLLSLSNPLGIVVAQVVTPLVVTKEEDFPTLNYIFGGVALLTELVTIVCITRSKPPSPPSQSAEKGEEVRAPYLHQLRATFTSGPYLLLLMALGAGVALFSSLATVTQQLLCPLGYSDVFGGIANAVMILCGFVGSVVTGITADRTKAFTPLTKLFYGLATICIIVTLELFMLPNQPYLIATFMGVFGFFGVGAYPIGLELAVEATYPVEETISTAFIFMSGQLQGVVIIALVTLLGRDQKPQYVDIQVCTKSATSEIEPRDYTVSLMAIMALISVIVSIMILFFDTPYKRLQAERANNSSDNTPILNPRSHSSSHSQSHSRSHSRSHSPTHSSHSLTTSGKDLEVVCGKGNAQDEKKEEKVNTPKEREDGVERSRF